MSPLSSIHFIRTDCGKLTHATGNNKTEVVPLETGQCKQRVFLSKSWELQLTLSQHLWVGQLKHNFFLLNPWGLQMAPSQLGNLYRKRKGTKAVGKQKIWGACWQMWKSSCREEEGKDAGLSSGGGGEGLGEMFMRNWGKLFRQRRWWRINQSAPPPPGNGTIW